MHKIKKIHKKGKSMKKYTCKLIPKNENAEAIEYDIELNETDKKPALSLFLSFSKSPKTTQ